jgi:1,2-diacylglycerol-3-alpha-glucose alpha-1,2-glucosyltransferase
MLNAALFVIPGYKTTGVISLMDAMAAKCQIIARKQAVFPDILVDGKTAYLGQFSETITSLIKDYLDGKLKPTTEEAYKYVSKYNLRATGEQLRWFYLEQINIKKLSK